MKEDDYIAGMKKETYNLLFKDENLPELNEEEAQKSKENDRILNEIANIGISKETRNKRMSNSRIQQIVTLLYLNKKITTSDGVLKHQTEKLQDLKSRIEHHIDYYSKNNLIQANFNFLNKIIDNWYNSSI